MARTISPDEIDPEAGSINWHYSWPVAGAVAVMIWAIASKDAWFLNFVHVAFGLLWTGIDLFMGFVIGPVLRMISFDARRQVVLRLMPKMLFLLTPLAIITTTSGWYLAELLGYFQLGYPEIWWVWAALAVVTVLTIQGLGILLPTNIRVYLEMRKLRPDGEKIGRLMRSYVRVVSVQGVMQVAIIVIMAKFATGV